MSIEPLAERVNLRRKLNCKPFQWFMNNVNPEVFVPKIPKDANAGCLQAEIPSDACVDTLGAGGSGDKVGAYPCHFQHGTQGVFMDGEGYIRFSHTSFEQCLQPRENGAGSQLELVHCTPRADERAQWMWDKVTRQLKPRSSAAFCLTAEKEQTDKSPFDLKLQPCSPGAGEQRWKWS